MARKKPTPAVEDAEIITPTFGFEKKKNIVPTRTLTLSELEGAPILTLAIADPNLNPDLQNATLVDLSIQSENGSLAPPPAESANMEERMAFVSRNRETDLRVFPYAVVIGWDENPPVDTEGNPVPFTRDNCAAFLNAIPDAMFDTIRVIARAREGFDLLADMRDVGTIAKN